MRTTLEQRVYAREYYAKNREIILAKQRGLYWEAPEKARAIRRVSCKKWRMAHPEQNKLRKKQAAQKLWIEFLAVYGNTCQICGESDVLTLTVGHLYKDGAAHRKAIGRGRNAGTSVILDLKRRGWPKTLGIATQCANCQLRQVRQG